MKLTKVRITEFQSVRDSNEFAIGDITCLVGKNEAGKTALLQALRRLNPDRKEPAKYDVTDDYPRTDVADYKEAVASGERRSAIVAQASFILEETELSLIREEFDNDVLSSDTLTLSNGYENKRTYSLSVNEQEVVKAMIAQAELASDIAKKLRESRTIKELDSAIKKASVDNEMPELITLQARIAPFLQPFGIAEYIYTNFLQNRVPKFLYFDEYSLMQGCENIQQLHQRQTQNSLMPSDLPLLGLLAIARLEPMDLLNLDRTQEFLNILDGAGTNLSKKVLKYWSQNKHVRLKFDIREARPGDPPGKTSGTNLWVHVEDMKHQVRTQLGTRSKGFQWFFSFLAWFDQQQKSKEPLILLLDEPGLFLHGKAQEDLLRYMEKELKGKHQVIYTTHSPFMVDPQRFDRVRIVQDKSLDTDEELPLEQEGTKVTSDVLEASSDSLFPLQGALGYEIYQSLFVGPNSLVVEGVSDLLYLQTLSMILEERRRTALDSRWTITPVGGADKVPTFVALLGAQRGMTVATLVDIQKKDAQTIENLYKRKLLKQKNVLTFAEFVEQDEADIEDMFDADFYITLINAAYKDELEKPLSLSALTSKHPRLLKRLEQYFEKHPLKNGRSFNHFAPAHYFTEHNVSLAERISDATLDRFEQAFNRLNHLLGK